MWPSSGDTGLLARMRSCLARHGLNIVLPLAPEEFDCAAGGVQGARLQDLLKGARGAMLVGDGGSLFFERFQASISSQAGDPRPRRARDPLDDHTALVLESAVAEALTPPHQTVSARLFYPFVRSRPALPFQRLGRAGGLPPPGPLGLQIHPVYGPWWAYRGLIVVSVAMAAEPALSASCSGCAGPCVEACPARAVNTGGFSNAGCLEHRLAAPACRDSCVARLACPLGVQHRYSRQQLAFHMNASMPRHR